MYCCSVFLKFVHSDGFQAWKDKGTKKSNTKQAFTGLQSRAIPNTCNLTDNPEAGLHVAAAAWHQSPPVATVRPEGERGIHRRRGSSTDGGGASSEAELVKVRRACQRTSSKRSVQHQHDFDESIAPVGPYMAQRSPGWQADEMYSLASLFVRGYHRICLSDADSVCV